MQNRTARQTLETPDAPNRNGSLGDHIIADKALPSPEVLRQLLRYEPETGKLIWLPRGQEWFPSKREASRWNARYSGIEAFYHVSATHGYKMGAVNGKTMRAHRLIWAIHYGTWPVDQVDHINNVRTDNRISNLRAATHLQNMANKPKAKGTSSRFIGVSFHHAIGKWQARISCAGKGIQLGYFVHEEDAARCRDLSAAKHYGPFARLNFPAS